MYCVCILYPWRWSHSWPKHVTDYRVYKLSLMYQRLFIGTTIVHTDHGSSNTWLFIYYYAITASDWIFSSEIW